MVKPIYKRAGILSIAALGLGLGLGAINQANAQVPKAPEANPYVLEVARRVVKHPETRVNRKVPFGRHRPFFDVYTLNVKTEDGRTIEAEVVDRDFYYHPFAHDADRVIDNQDRIELRVLQDGGVTKSFEDNNLNGIERDWGDHAVLGADDDYGRDIFEGSEDTKEAVPLVRTIKGNIISRAERENQEYVETLEELEAGMRQSDSLRVGDVYTREGEELAPGSLARRVLAYEPKETKEVEKGKQHIITEFPLSERIAPLGFEIGNARIRPTRVEYRDLEPRGPSNGDELRYTVRSLFSNSIADSTIFRNTFHGDGYTNWHYFNGGWQNDDVFAEGWNVPWHDANRAFVDAVLLLEMDPDALKTGDFNIRHFNLKK